MVYPHTNSHKRDGDGGLGELGKKGPDCRYVNFPINGGTEDLIRYISALQRIAALKDLKAVTLEGPDSLVYEAISIAEYALEGKND